MISIYNLTFSILKSKIAPNVIIGIYSITHINLKSLVSNKNGRVKKLIK
ncbi:Uncharacterised protein [uncultured Bacteroides sp.]|nr:Uncharacterised protein [uncultured Bacteroides sp.]